MKRSRVIAAAVLVLLAVVLLVVLGVRRAGGGDPPSANLTPTPVATWAHPAPGSPAPSTIESLGYGDPSANGGHPSTLTVALLAVTNHPQLTIGASLPTLSESGPHPYAAQFSITNNGSARFSGDVLSGTEAVIVDGTRLAPSRTLTTTAGAAIPPGTVSIESKATLTGWVVFVAPNDLIFATLVMAPGGVHSAQAAWNVMPPFPSVSPLPTP